MDLDAEQRQTEEEMRRAAEWESRIDSGFKRALRKLEQRIEGLESELQRLGARRDYLIEVVQGKVKPSAVDLPKEEAENIATKIMLRLKGVRGLAVKKASEELGPLEEKIQTTEDSIERLEQEAEELKKQRSEAKALLSELMESIRNQETLIRRIATKLGSISALVSTFGWYNPYLLARKCWDEIHLTRRNLLRHQISVQKRSQEVTEVEKRITDLKRKMASVLGEAYEHCLIPIVFKDGASPKGRKFLEGELTMEDVRSLNLSSKISRPKTLQRKADRLRSALWQHRSLVSEALMEMARLGELKQYTKHLLSLSMANVKATRKILGSKIELFTQLVGACEACAELQTLASAYHEQSKEMAWRKERAAAAVNRLQSDL